MTAQSPVQGNGAQEIDSESSDEQSRADVSFPIQTNPTIRPVLVWMVITVALAAAVIGYISGNVEAVGGQEIANVLVQVVGAIAVLVLVRLAIKVFVLTRTEYLVDESRIRRQYSLLLRTWEREVPAETRRAIAETFSDRERIVVESLPDFVDREKIADFTDQGLATDVAVGLETATDRVRHDCVNKYFDFEDFEDACAEARAADAEADAVDVGVKAYLLMKPPFLSESEAIEDMKSSIRRCAGVEGCHTVSMNPTNVQKYTEVEQLYFEDGYRPPWLWSVAEVLEATVDEDVIVVSDPVGHGSDRGAHNCGECDDRVQTAIKDFNLRQDPNVFEQVSCDCELTWETVVERETGYNLPLAR